MAKKPDTASTDLNPQDSLVDALESIKSLLAKSDSKLAAARESIAIASSQTAINKMNLDKSGQYEIPVLDDIISPAEIESATEEVSNISEKISEKIEETLAAVSESINPAEIAAAKPDPQIMLDYLDDLQKNFEKALRASLMKNIVTIEVGLKKTLNSEMNKIRKKIKKDFK
jgi:hypothetical protein